MGWNYGDILDAVARVVPADRPALIWGGDVVTWAAFDRRTNNLARRMIEYGLAPDDRVAVLCRNHPAYIEATVAALKSRTVSVNVNYRYTADEIVYVLEDCGAAALFYQDSLDATIAELKARLPGVALWIRIESDRQLRAAADGEQSFEAWAQAGDGAPLDIQRSPEDSYLLYTGGTTGRPKGVLWRTGDARKVQLESPLIAKRPADLAEHSAMVRDNLAPSRTIPACPLMHGAGSNAVIGELMAGGGAVLLPSDRFDADELWREVERTGVTRIAIVGDVFARPMLRALEAAPGRYDLSSLKVISSAGLIWSGEVKAGLLAHLPGVALVDILGASEASGFGYSVATADNVPATGVFAPGAKTVLIDPDTGAVLPKDAPGEGLLARTEPVAAGYYRDPTKTAETYRMIDGVRYAVPGDFARLGADGQLTLIGRGNLSINTGGEKVFPEEVEEALKLQPGVEDALVVGEPDPTWGKSIVAIVKSTPAFDEAAVRAGLQKTLASYKLPRRFLHVEVVPRHESGKADYRTAQALITKPEPVEHL
ncbi:MAG: acyl-CoA synthetase [Phenylobacterium sp.]|uniref:acyl-CoA synthetase n=1 Tax=Phenylobacterium sp. TaxID=1871053 RepID=UPI002736EC11|nr:acyl-CoA synthetase [Phenylobacterium sp.]MDP3745742.1 acyl-CoA synthetase [Phenylobacterium sp.]